MDQQPSPKSTCIFCGRSEQEVSFNREHIIPQNVGGTLFLDDAVCVDCNSDHGARFDHEVLKLPEVLDALESLNLAHDRNGIINKHYKVTGKSDSLELKFGMARGQDFLFSKQALPDGSLIVPEGADAFSALRHKVRRDRRLQDAGLSESEIQQSIDELRLLYEQAGPIQEIECPGLGLTVHMGVAELSINVSPRENADIHPLIAKIAYEMFFFCLGPEFLGQACSNLRSELLASIQRKKQQGVFIMRQTPRTDHYRPLHFVRLEFTDHTTLIRVVFFDHIEYLLVTRPTPKAMVADLEVRVGVSDLHVLVYQQELGKSSKSFWALSANGKAACILAT